MKKQSTWIAIDWHDTTLIIFRKLCCAPSTFLPDGRENTEFRIRLSVFSIDFVISAIASSNVASLRFCLYANFDLMCLWAQRFPLSNWGSLLFCTMPPEFKVSWMVASRFLFLISMAVVRCGQEFLKKIKTLTDPMLSKQTLSCYYISTGRTLKWWKLGTQSDLGVWYPFRKLEAKISWNFRSPFNRKSEFFHHASSTSFVIRSQSSFFHLLERWKNNCKKEFGRKI